MKRLFLAGIAAASLCVSLAGCSALGSLGLGTPAAAVSTANSAELTGDKAYYAAEAAYVGGLQLINAGIAAGVIHGQTAVTVKGYVVQANDALQAAKAARAAGDTALETAKASLSLSLIGQASSSAPPAATPAPPQ